jgi:radical SAM protein with 4Fe4S-binding SPASM domain
MLLKLFLFYLLNWQNVSYYAKAETMGVYDLCDEFDDLLNISKKLAQDLDVELTVSPPSFTDTIGKYSDRCDLPWNFFLFDQIGDVYPCCFLWGQKFGNVFGNSFDDIWNGNEFRKLRTEINSKGYGEICLSSNCPRWSLRKPCQKNGRLRGNYGTIKSK